MAALRGKGDELKASNSRMYHKAGMENIMLVGTISRISIDPEGVRQVLGALHRKNRSGCGNRANPEARGVTCHARTTRIYVGMRRRNLGASIELVTHLWNPADEDHGDNDPHRHEERKG